MSCSEHDETRGLWLGLLGVTIFAMTVPMTRLAVGPSHDPQLSPLFVTAGRAALAGLLSAVYLLASGAARPRQAQWHSFMVCALGTVVGFPMFMVATAVAAAIAFRQRPSIAFWACAVLGCALVLVFAAQQGQGRLSMADGLLLLSVASAAIGYVAGARLSAQMSAEQVICWVLVLSLPLTLPAALASWPSHAVQPSAWLGFGYVSLFSMWLGFFAWYRGLALGGTVRVSQVQLVQPFLALLFAVPVLGETLDATTVAYSLAVIAIVFAGKNMPTQQRSERPAS
jgi:drug/metabolite transporter (DMT)-like permease